MDSKFFVFLLIVNFSCFNVYSQSKKATLAGQDYDKFAYVKAVSTYERIAEKGYKSEEILQKLGNSYYFNGQLEKSYKWYQELFDLNSNQDSEYIYRYSQSLKAVGQTSKANQMLELFTHKVELDSRAQLYASNKNYLEQIKANSGRYKIEDAGVNSKHSDYGSALFGNKLVFSSSRDTGNIGKRKHSWTNQNFTDLYCSDLGSELVPGPIKNFSAKINSKFNESTPIFTKDGKTMYFTRNNYLDGKKGTDGKSITLLKIYRASFDHSDWGSIEELPFNNDLYSTAHPALSADEKTLYFVSNMPGSFGQSDIYKVAVNENGSFGLPENLGKKINTEGRETFPCVTNEDELYFASDGHPGLGGLDVFVGQLDEKGGIGDIQNLGDEINSPKDDFGYWLDTKSRKGFFSSNREGGQGYDDIYKFLEVKRLKCVQTIAGIVTDASSLEPLSGAEISLYDSSFKLITTTTADSFGKYSFDVSCEKTYVVRAEQPDYNTEEQKKTISKDSGTTSLNFELDSKIVKVAIGQDLAKTFDIKMIYFDLGKYDIKPKAEIELSKILQAMLDNPKIKIDVRSHTDCRQSAKNNMILSENRVKSTISWLINNGITSNRLSGRGYGESQLINNCGCEPTSKSDCTEEQHQANRRSEFIVISL